MNIILNIDNDFVITARNKKTNEFYIQPKGDFEKVLEGKNIFSTIEGFYSEKAIIEMMKKSKFYTYSNGVFTTVYESKGNIKSVPNDTTKDNIGSLPII